MGYENLKRIWMSYEFFGEKNFISFHPDPVY